MSATPSGPHDWPADSYHRVSQPHRDWATQILDRLALRGDEVVLDAGCGSGRLTEQLLARVPSGRVLAVDATPSMIELAAKRLPERAEFSVQDLTALALVDQVDVVVSSATFHWIADHDLLFARIAAVLRPGGRFEAQCGGAGNIASVEAAVARLRERSPWREAFTGWDGPWNFAGPEETGRRLAAAGFVDVRCTLEPRSVTPEDPYSYLHAVVLGAHLERLPVDVHDDFVEAVRQELTPAGGGPVVLDYVRLNISARRAGAEPRPGETVGQLTDRLRDA